MLKHLDVWQAIDQLAAKHRFSPSGLARRAGLDPTTFNKSKRVARDGRPRWPSTESIAKILEATESTIGDFVAYLGARVVQRVPVASFPQASGKGAFDPAGHPVGGTWDELMFPDIADPHVYALEISGDGLAPIYRDGNTILVSPEAGLRKGDRVVVKTVGDQLLVKTLVRRGARKLDLADLNPGAAASSLAVESVVFMHRIIWASQ